MNGRRGQDSLGDRLSQRVGHGKGGNPESYAKPPQLCGLRHAASPFYFESAVRRVRATTVSSS